MDIATGSLLPDVFGARDHRSVRADRPADLVDVPLARVVRWLDRVDQLMDPGDHFLAREDRRRVARPFPYSSTRGCHRSATGGRL